MSKIVKGAVIGAVVLGAFVATGGTSSLAGFVFSSKIGAALALSYTASAVVAGAIVGAALAGLSSLVSPSLANMDEQAGSKLPVTGRVDTYKKVYGAARIGGAEVFIHAYDSTAGNDIPNDTLVFARVVAAHPIAGFGTFRIGDKTVTFDGSGNAIGEFANHLYLKTYDGTQVAADPWLSAAGANWDANHIGTDVAYYVIKAIYDAEKFPYGASELRQCSIEVTGAKLYDPRLDSTQTAIGGSGTHRINDDTTWEYSTNPALAIYDTLRDQRLGVVVPEAAIDLATVVALANHCDEQVSVNGGGTIDRYSLSGVVDSARSKLENVKLMLTSCAGRLGWQGGKIKLHGSYMTASVYTFDTDSVKGVESYSSLPPIDQRYNTVKGTFISATEDFNAVDYPAQVDSADVALEGEVAQTLNLPFTQDHRIAQRLARIALNQANRPIMQLALMPVGLVVEPWDIVTVNWPNLGISSQTFRVIERTIQSSGSSDFCTVTLIEDDSANYSWTAGTDELTRSSPVTLAEPDTTGPVGDINSEIIDGATDTLIKDAWFNKQSGNLSTTKAWAATSGWSFPTTRVTLPLSGNSVKVAKHTPASDDYEFPATKVGEDRLDGARIYNKPFFITGGELINVAIYGKADSGTDGIARVGLSFYDGNGQFIEERVNDDAIPPSIGAWGTVRRLLTAPAGAVFAEFFVIIRSHTAGVWYISGVDAKRVGLATDQNIGNLDGADILDDVITADSMGYLVKRWDFAGDALGWTFTNATVTHDTISAQITTTSSDCTMRSPTGLNIDGSVNNLVFVRMRRRVGATKNYEKVKVYYATAGHGFGEAYTVLLQRRFVTDQFITFAFDMHNLLRGGDDWATNTIDQIRIDPSVDSGDEFDIDWIGIGRTSAAGNAVQGVNVADSLAFVQVSQTDTDTGAQIGSLTLAEMGLDIGDAISATLSITGNNTRQGRVYMVFNDGVGTISSKYGSWVDPGEVSRLPNAVIPDTCVSIDFWLGRETGGTGAVGCNQLMVVEGPVAKSFIQLRADVAENATSNTIYRQASAPSNPIDGDIWVDTDATPVVTYTRVGGAWNADANIVTNTNEVTDGAGLGNTANWSQVANDDSNRPADGATKNTIYRQASAPSSPINGDMWVDTSGTPNLHKVRVGGAWQVGSSYNTGALADEDIATWVAGGTAPGDTLKNGVTTSISLQGVVSSQATGTVIRLEYTPYMVCNAGTSEELQVEFFRKTVASPTTQITLQTERFIVTDQEYQVPMIFSYDPGSAATAQAQKYIGVKITAVDSTYDVNIDEAAFNVWQESR